MKKPLCGSVQTPINTVRRFTHYLPPMDQETLVRYRLIRSRLEFGPTPGSKIVDNVLSNQSSLPSVRSFAKFVDEKAGDIHILSSAGYIINAVTTKNFSEFNKWVIEIHKWDFSTDVRAKKECLELILNTTADYNVPEMGAIITSMAGSMGIKLDKPLVVETQSTPTSGPK